MTHIVTDSIYYAACRECRWSGEPRALEEFAEDDADRHDATIHDDDGARYRMMKGATE